MTMEKPATILSMTMEALTKTKLVVLDEKGNPTHAV
jgi:hypothetical protein